MSVTLQDISDGMPWCEERLVRKVLFLSLREFRDTHRATHKHSHIRAHKHNRTSKSALSHAQRKTKPLQQRVTRRPQNTHTQKKTHSSKKCHISKHVHAHEHTNKVQKNNLSQDSHTPKDKLTHTLQHTKTPSKMCGGKTAQNTHAREGTHTFQKNSESTRTLRSHKTQTTLSLLDSKYRKTVKHSQSTQHKDSVKNTCTHETPQTLLGTPVPARTLRSRTPRSLSGQFHQYSVSSVLYLLC